MSTSCETMLARYSQTVKSDFTIYAKLLDSDCDIIPRFRPRMPVRSWLAKWAAQVKQLF